MRVLFFVLMFVVIIPSSFVHGFAPVDTQKDMTQTEILPDCETEDSTVKQAILNMGTTIKEGFDRFTFGIRVILYFTGLFGIENPGVPVK